MSLQLTVRSFILGIVEADEKFKSRTAYAGSDSKEGDPVQMLMFPSREHVKKLTPGQLHPKVFCSKYLPEHQAWMNKQTGNEATS